MLLIFRCFLKKKVRLAGFTLIELMVVTGIFAFLSGTAITASPNTEVKLKVMNVSATLQGDFRQAQLLASSVNTQGRAVAGYGINFSSDFTNGYQPFVDKVTPVQVNGLFVGNKKYDGPSEDSSVPVILPYGYRVTDVCVDPKLTSKPFFTCRSTGDVGELTVLYIRPSAQPSIYANNNENIRYASACIQVEYNSVNRGRGFVRNIIVTKSGLISVALGGCRAGNALPPPLAGMIQSTIDLFSFGSGSVGLAVDPFGNVYITNASNAKVTTVTAVGLASVYGNDLPGSPADMTVDSSGTLYVSSVDKSKTTYTKYIPGYPPIQVTLPSVDPQPNNPTKIAIDPSGFLYTISKGSDKIWKINPVTGVQTVFGTSDAGAHDITIDGFGNVYVSNTNSVTKLDKNGAILWTTPAPSIKSIAVTPQGTAYFFTPPGSINRISPDGTLLPDFAITGSGTEDYTTDALGNVYAINSKTNTILKITPQGVMTTLANTGVDPKYIKVIGTTVYVLNVGSNTLTKVVQ